MSGDTNLIRSEKDYDWLGPGIYFWESDPVRAQEWAAEKAGNGKYDEPFVVGAIIDLGNCLDLMSREDLELVADAYHSLHEIHEKDGTLENLPTNERGEDKLLRYLDCAVIRHLHEIADDTDLPNIEPIDTVRGLFTEGAELFPGSGFKSKTHIQISVVNPDRIKGFFRVS